MQSSDDHVNARPVTRRQALKGFACLIAAGAGGLRLEASGLGAGAAKAHPRIYLSGDASVRGLRTVKGLRESISSGLSRSLWQRLLESAQASLDAPALTPRSPYPGRLPGAAERNNPGYVICRAAGERLLRHALAFIVTEEEVYRQACLRQLHSLFDDAQWPEWIDQAHLRYELPADLRTGMLSLYASLAYDWLAPSLNGSERAEIIAGIDRRGIQPFLQSIEQDPWWSRDMNNWLTVIYGGLGIAGMCLHGEHPQAQRLIEEALPKFNEYLGSYGALGEFNESVAYSNASFFPVAFFHAYGYYRKGQAAPLGTAPFPEAGRWSLYATLPPGRYAAFGDGGVAAEPQVEHFAAIAAASRDRIVQGYVERHLSLGDTALPLLWYDPSLHGEHPEGRLPLGKVFPDKAGLVFSRSSWNLDTPEMIVYGKAKRDENHGHNDLGQLCIDSRGERLIVDLGSPSSYPPDFFEAARWEYYNASTVGHNVLQFGGREQRSPPEARGAKTSIDLEAYNGRYVQTRFDDRLGAYWQIDLSNAYSGARSVRRTVVHLLPGIVAVLDEAELEKEEEIVLRWHTIALATLEADGRFAFDGERVGLACQALALEGALLGHAARRHEYKAPFDKDRAGQPLEKRREPYVETRVIGQRCRLLSLFALREPGDQATRWRGEGRSQWQVSSRDEGFEVELTAEVLECRSQDGRRKLRVTL